MGEVSSELEGLPGLMMQYVEAFKAVEVDYVVGDEGNVLMTFGDTSAGRCDGFVVVTPLGAVDPIETDNESLFDHVEVAFLVPIKEIPKDRRPAMYEVVGRLNEIHRLGAFELDAEEPELRFRSYQVHMPDTAVPRALLLAPVYEALTSIDEQWPAFEMVLEGGRNAKHAAGEVLARKAIADDGIGMDEEFYAGAVRMLKMAIEDYTEAGDKAAAQDVADRLAILGAEIQGAVSDALN